MAIAFAVLGRAPLCGLSSGPCRPPSSGLAMLPHRSRRKQKGRWGSAGLLSPYASRPPIPVHRFGQSKSLGPPKCRGCEGDASAIILFSRTESRGEPVTLGAQVGENVIVECSWEEGKPILGSTLFVKTPRSFQDRLERQPLYLTAFPRKVL